MPALDLKRTKMDIGNPPAARGSEEASSVSLLDGHMATLAISTENSPALLPTSTSAPPSESASEAEERLLPVQSASDAAKTIMMSFEQFVDVVCDWEKKDTGAWRDTVEHSAELLADGASLHDIIDRHNLQGIKEVLESMNEARDTAYSYLQHALAPLGDMLRLPDFRGSFGEAGILEFCLNIIMQRGGLLATKTIVHQALRVVGNAVIDDDENRARVVARNHTKALIELLQDPELAPLALSVLNNVCDGNEPAQVQAAQNGIVEALMPILDHRDNEALVTMAWTLVELASRHAKAIESSPDGILEPLIRLALQPDLPIEDFLTLTNALLNYLKVIRFQELFVKLGAAKTVYLIVRHDNLDKFNDALHEETQELSRNCLALVSTISDCSDLPIFAERCPFQTFKDNVLSFTGNNNDKNVQLLGCILAGNYANSEELCREVIDAGVHSALVSVVTDSADARVLHSALSALKNLAIPKTFRPQLAETGIFDRIVRVFTMSITPQVQLVSVSLIRLLITNTVPNITQHLLRSPPASAADNPSSPLTALLTLFSSTDSLPIHLEIGRTITEIFRCLVSAPSPHDQLEPAYSTLHSEHSILLPIAAMIKQAQYLPLRSEALFILALISRRKDGCVAVAALLEDVQVFEVLVETVTGKEKGKAEEGVGRGVGSKDRENAIVLGVEMARNGKGAAWLGEEEARGLVNGEQVEGVYAGLERRLEEMKRGGSVLGEA